MDILQSLLAFIVALGLLVTVHEAGHFLVAKRLGVKVLRFSVGFGRPLWSRRAGPDETEYVVAAVPLGGYVKMLDEREGEVAQEELPRAFNRQSLWVRTAVVVAGPVANFLFAIVAYWVMFMLGVGGLKPIVGQVTPDSPAARAGLERGDEIVSAAGQPAVTWEGVVQTVIRKALDGQSVSLQVRDVSHRLHLARLDLSGIGVDDIARGGFFERLGVQPLRPTLPPVIGRLEHGGAAERDGLQPGDRILRADGKPVDDWRDWVEYVRSHGGTTTPVEVRRKGGVVTLLLRPDVVQENGTAIGRIGAAVSTEGAEFEDFYAVERYGPLTAAARAVGKTYAVTSLTLDMLWKMLLLEVSVDNLSGPISIARYAGDSAKIGLSRFMEFLGIVSVSLGILNLLPIPLLDGGHLMYYLIELFKGRPVSEDVQVLGQRVGLAILAGLMGLAFFNDLARLLG